MSIERPIIINVQHAVEIDTALKAGQGRASVRTVANFEELNELIEDCRRGISIPKTRWHRCRLSIRVGAGSFPNAYKAKGAPMCTYVEVVFGKDGQGRLVDVGRTYADGGREHVWRLTAEAKQSLLKSMNIDPVDVEPTEKLT